MMTETFATLWGIDKGELVCPTIYLWKTNKGIMDADNLGGALAHGTRVVVKQIDDDGWILVSKKVEHEGETYPQEGYVRESLVKFDNK
jgi:hypothetical protein